MIMSLHLTIKNEKIADDAKEVFDEEE